VTLAGAGSADIVLLAHLDTVFPHGTVASRPFHIEADRALGPGVCDMKAGLLSAVYAVDALRTLGFDRFGRLRLVCTSDEEVGAPSSRVFVEQVAAGARAVLVLEAARQNGDLVTQRRGGGFYRLAITGRSAHAGVEPEKGRSAALTLCRQVVALHALTDLAQGRTINVGTLHAGSRANVVPDCAVAEVDVRANTQAEMALLLAAANEALDREVIEGTSYTWNPLWSRPPWEPSDATAHLLAVAQAVSGVVGFTVQGAATGGTSDGNYTAALPVPTLDGLGPIGGLDHGPLEYVEISSIVPRTTLLAGLIAAIAAA
jgi:glutamate carboxypeptidase